MNAFFFRRRWLLGGAVAGLLALGSLAVHPSGRVKAAEGQAAADSELSVPPEIARALKRSCMDCHSNHTVWPWYSYVAPISWLVERDVRQGRDHMNFSEWDRYTFEQRAKLLAEIASTVKNREMPLPQYTLIHRAAKLSEAETDLVYVWARGERRRVKTQFGFVPASAGHAQAAADENSK